MLETDDGLDAALVESDGHLNAPNPLSLRARLALLIDNSTLAIVFGVFVVMRAMDRVFSKRVVDRMANYQLMCSHPPTTPTPFLL